MKMLYGVLMALVAAAWSGCGTASLDAGYHEDDFGSSPGGEPASLFEMEFGAGGREVTKNIPADAAEGVSRAVKSINPKTTPEIVTE